MLGETQQLPVLEPSPNFHSQCTHYPGGEETIVSQIIGNSLKFWENFLIVFFELHFTPNNKSINISNIYNLSFRF